MKSRLDVPSGSDLRCLKKGVLCDVRVGQGWWNGRVRRVKGKLMVFKYTNNKGIVSADSDKVSPNIIRVSTLGQDENEEDDEDMEQEGRGG